MSDNNLRLLTYRSLLDLATDKGINASGKDEIYGCIFGRDTAITVLKILNACSRNQYYSGVQYEMLQSICRRALLTLTELQGKEFNSESGEEPGKYAHEYRTEKYDHLLSLPKPWYIYPDNTLKNYDSIDSTPLALIAIYKYVQLTNDTEFLETVLPSVEKGLTWIMTLGDKDGDGLMEYEFPDNRKHGGSYVQSWTDSPESLMRPDGTMPTCPIAPVEVQGYGWLALKLWADFYAENNNTELSEKLLAKAQHMKKEFNEKFIYKQADFFFAAQALDGDKNQIRTVTGNTLLLLWASYRKDEERESILNAEYIPDIVGRSFQQDLFDEGAGIRTMSTLSPTFISAQNSYHNGSFWPKLNGMAHEGLERWGFHQEAHLLRFATLKPLYYFGTPIELYLKGPDGTYLEFKAENGHTRC